MSFYLSLAQLEFLAKAIDFAHPFPVMRCAYLASNEHGVFMVATDTKRLHVVKVNAEIEPSENLLVDVERILLEIKFSEGQGARFEVLGQRTSTVAVADADGDCNKPMHTPCFFSESGVGQKYPKWEPIVSRDFSDSKGLPGASFTFEYLVDASYLAADGGYDRVYLLGGNPFQSFAVCGRSCEWFDQPWFAVIQPQNAPLEVGA